MRDALILPSEGFERKIGNVNKVGVVGVREKSEQINK